MRLARAPCASRGAVGALLVSETSNRRRRAGSVTGTRSITSTEQIVQVRSHHALTELAPLCDQWDRLAGGCPFRTWTWLSTWWRHYGEGRRPRRLFVIAAYDDSGDVAAILPCYATRSLVRGRTLRLLGDGEICSEHLGLLAAPKFADAAAEAIADFLADACDWDLADFVAVDENDQPTSRLFAALGNRRCHATRHPGNRTWAIDLTAAWDEFLALQSKSHRKQLRQIERRVLDGDRARWHLVEDAKDFECAWSILVDLHQRRRQSLGEPGCFSSPRWAAFHHDVARRMLVDGRLRLSWLELDGAPVAAEYHLAGCNATYAYQGGVDPDRLAEEPGRISTICSIRCAIAEGHTHFDFLRGDEPYKAHWRATPRTVWRWQAAAPRRLPIIRKQAWTAALRIGQLGRRVAAQFG
jgi:CelD/BcsL family acetyltransferase involved in cellulose biosynthesis